MCDTSAGRTLSPELLHPVPVIRYKDIPGIHVRPRWVIPRLWGDPESGSCLDHVLRALYLVLILTAFVLCARGLTASRLSICDAWSNPMLFSTF